MHVGKSLYHPSPMGVDDITPQPMKRFLPPLNFSKPVKLPSKAVLKNHSKSEKKYKMENPIVLDSE